MSEFVLVVCWVLASLLTISLISRYRSFERTPTIILIAVFLSWILPISLTFLLPIDIASARYEQCLETNPASECHMSWLYCSPSLRHYTWLTVYWTLFLLTWLAVPFLQGFELSGQFTFLGKCWFSLKMNFIFYGVMVLLVVLIAAYLKSFSKITTTEGITAFLMALTNAGGLMAVMIFLGHGLIRLPRHLWQKADAKLQLSKLEGRALAVKEELDDAEHELSIIIRQVHALPHRVPRDRAYLRFLVEDLVLRTPLPSDEELAGDNVIAINAASIITEPVTLSYLEALNFRLPMIIEKRNRAEWEWRQLLEDAWHWQDVIENIRLNLQSDYQIEQRSEFAPGDRRLWCTSLETESASQLMRSIYWWWNCRIRPTLLRSISCVCVVLSCAIFWSEITLAVTGADISLMRALLGIHEWMADLFASIFLLYMALCTYSSFLRLRVFSYFKLVPGQHTDTLSLLFFAAYITRLTFPLGYNFVTMVDRRLKTQFAVVMGTMNLVPLLGQSFNYYVPITLTFICTIFLFRLHSHVRTFLERFSLFQNDQDDDGGNSIQADATDGGNLISRARREEERTVVRKRVYGTTNPTMNNFSWRLNRSSTFPLDQSGIRTETVPIPPPTSSGKTLFGADDSLANSPSSPLFSRLQNPWATS